MFLRSRSIEHSALNKTTPYIPGERHILRALSCDGKMGDRSPKEFDRYLTLLTARPDSGAGKKDKSGWSSEVVEDKVLEGAEKGNFKTIKGKKSCWGWWCSTTADSKV